MKILIVSQYFWPENFCINDIAMQLQGQGHDVEVLTGYPNYPVGKIHDGYGVFRRKGRDYHGVKIRRVPLMARGGGGSLRLAMNYLSFAFFSCLLGPFLCRKRYDVIFVYEPSPITVTLPALWLKAIRGIPVVLWVQDLWPESVSATGAIRSKAILSFIERLVRFIYRHCDRILVQSEAFRKSVEVMGARSDRVEYYPNSVDAFYKPLELEAGAAERDEVRDGFRVIFAGNVGVAQDFPTILSAAERLKGRQDIQWVIIGDGRNLPWVEAEVRRRGLERTVQLLGRKPSESMPRYLAIADVLLLTLKKDPIFALTLPTKLQAYLACGRPVLAGIDGEASRVVTEAGAGLTCPAEQPDMLADRVIEFCQMDEGRRREMGKRARAYSESHFDGRMLLERLDGIIRDVAIRSRKDVSSGNERDEIGEVE